MNSWERGSEIFSTGLKCNVLRKGEMVLIMILEVFL